MNAIQLDNRVDLYCDITRNARYQRLEKDNAINDAIRIIIDGILNPDETIRSKKGFQYNQFVSDNLYTLQKLQTAAPTATIALYPTDYYFLTSIYATIGGTSYFCRPTTEGEVGPMEIDSYRKSSSVKPYYLQKLTGFKIYSGAGTVTSVDLNYIKTQATVTIGKDSQIIAAGAGVLTLAVSYIAIEPSVQNAVSYNIGDQFTAAVTTTLTSGAVILTSNVTNCDLPAKLHEKVAKLAASILTGVTQAYSPSAFDEKEAQKS